MQSLSPTPSRLRSTALALALVLGIASLPARSIAQYMYLDSNGDGVNTAEDVVNPTGTTTIDIYVQTDQNRDGSAPVCPVDKPFTINSYEVILRAETGTVSWDSFMNRQGTMTVSFGAYSTSTEFYRGLGGASTLPPGLYHLATVSISVLTGAPTLGFAIGGGRYHTSFGSQCGGIDGDNTLKLGSDWFDTDGLSFGTTTPINHPPVLAQPSDMTVLSGEVAAQIVTATDPDAQFLTIEKGTGPGYMSVLGGTSERGSASASIRLAPLSGDVGPSTGSVRVTDGEVTDERSFAISVLMSPEHATEIEAIPDVTLLAGTVMGMPVYATDADGSALEFRKTGGPPFVDVASLSHGPVASTGAIRIAPTRCDVGTWRASVTVDGGADPISVEFQIVVRLPEAPPSEPGGIAAVAPNPAHVALRDFNHDGRIDAVSVSESAGSISVILGNGDGTFGQRTDYPVGQEPWFVAAGDWNQDGHVDLAVANLRSNTLSILSGVGDGSFSVGAPLSTRPRPNSITPADLNGDGLEDLIVANGGDSFVSVFLGGPAGTFQPRRDFAVNGSPYGAVIGDFNLDGRPDVVTANFVAHTISYFPGFGDGTLGVRSDIPMPGSPFSVTAADFDGDGVLDIAVPEYEPIVTVLLGNGDGTFRSVASLEVEGGVAQYAVAKDFDGDGRTDLAVGGSGYFRNLGGGAFASTTASAPYSSASLDAADMDGDGRLDVVTVDSYPYQTISVSLNIGGIGIAPEGRAFTQGDSRTVAGNSGAGSVSVWLEPINSSYANSDVAYSTLEMISNGTGSVERISVITDRPIQTGDSDRNGIGELLLRFAASDLQSLFEDVGKRQSVDVRIEGSLASGKRLCAPLRMTVSGHSKPLAARVTPNPLNPSGVLAFRTSSDGYVRVRMFDLNGRLVRTLADIPLVVAGDQEVRIDGRGARGETLATGAYFYVIETPEGKTRGRIMILK